MYPFQNPQFPNYSVYNPNSFPMQNNPRLVCRQVGSVEEARSAIIDPVSLYLFPDFSTGKIYVKKMGDNGQSEFYSYSQDAEQKPVDPFDEIKQRLSNIEAKLGGHDESIPVPKKSHARTSSGSDAEDAAE